MSKVWFVTGSSRGLGRALVEVALDGGDRVVATARNPERLRSLVEKYGDAVLVLRLDVTDYDAAARVVAQAKEAFGRIDVVVNNAGGTPPTAALDLEVSDFEAAFHFNVSSAFLLTRRAVPHMVKSGGGAVVNISSALSHMVEPGFVAYGTAKTTDPSQQGLQAVMEVFRPTRDNPLILNLPSTVLLVASRRGWPETGRGRTSPNSVPTLQLDHILRNDPAGVVRPYGVRVADAPVSDHRALVAELDIAAS